MNFPVTVSFCYFFEQNRLNCLALIHGLGSANLQEASSWLTFKGDEFLFIISCVLMSVYDYSK